MRYSSEFGFTEKKSKKKLKKFEHAEFVLTLE